MLRLYELMPRYDARQSFYNKATIQETNTNYILLSYNTPVIKLNKKSGSITINKNIDESLLFSNTTMRHIKEFLKQFTSARCETKKDLLKLKKSAF